MINVMFFLAPSSCLVTEWGEWDVCSATCGLGMKRRERMVKMPPSDGSICGADVVEVEKCMMPECRELKGTCTKCTQNTIYIYIYMEFNIESEVNYCPYRMNFEYISYENII